MEIKYEPKSADILNKCLDIMDKPMLVVVDTRSTSYRNNREIIDQKQERKLLTSQIDDTAYYDELSKDFN